MKALRMTIALTILLAITGIVNSCTTNDNPIGGDSDTRNYNKNSKQNQGVCVDTIPVSELDSTEKQALLFMVEEEKMAHDVYAKFFDMYDQKIFSNIYSSEAKHQNSLSTLINKYGLIDPTINMQIGEFENSSIKTLYDLLLSQGVTATDALMVGALIEETDIRDLDNAIIETDNPDIAIVYENLRKGSENHLRSFVSSLSSLGVTYSPKVLTAEQYAAIVKL